MSNLNNLELATLERVAIKNPSLAQHIPYLKVKERKLTGVGMFVKFEYSDKVGIINNIEPTNVSLGTRDPIKMTNLKYGLGFEVDISNGRVNYIEFVTYGEEWDGSISEFHFANS
jgi:hypothetical protein